MKYCGYENCYTISTLEEIDLDHFQTEVRKGNMAKFLEDNLSEGIVQKDALEGSTKSVEEFEFSRGHQKLIMAIAKLVKENLNENGVDGFAETSTEKKKKSASNMSPRKRQKYSAGKQVMKSNLRKPETMNLGENSYRLSCDENNVAVHDAHRTVLVTKALASLINLTPKMYEKVSMHWARKLLSHLDQIS